MLSQVVKRDGTIVDFDISKITNAISKAAKSTREIPYSAIEVMSNSVVTNLINTNKENNQISVEDIQDEVERILIQNNYSDIAKSYILYRDSRTKAREATSYITKTLSDIISKDANDSDIKRENGNINADTSAGTMYKFGAETSKWFALKNLIRPEIAKLHNEKFIHINDLDYYAWGGLNCVSSSTRIILRDPNGKLINTEANFFSKLGEGVHYLKDWKILSRNNQFVDLINVAIRQEKDHINIIKSVHGYIEVTDNHIVPVIRDGKEVEVLAKDVKIGDKLINQDESIEDNNIFSIDKEKYSDLVYDFETGDHFFVANNQILHNCLQIPVGDLLKRGFHTGHGFIRPPQSIGTATTQAAIILQSNQNEMYGGQSIPMFDFYMAPYVKKSYIRNIVSIVEIEESEDIAKDVKIKLEEINKEDVSLFSKDKSVMVIIHSVCRDKELSTIEKWIKIAKKRTDKDVYQAMEGLIHNLCTLNSRAGNQCPFSSINFGMDTSEEGRMVSKNLMLAQDAGLGRKETPIFPILIFTIKSGYNYNPEDPNYDLFKLACKVSAKRLFPNFFSIENEWNGKYFKEGHPETIVSVMGILTGDEIVLVKDKEDQHIVKIKDLIDNIFSNEKPKKAVNIEDTFYIEIDNLEIWDNGKFVKIRKVLKWVDCTKSKWYKVTLVNSDNEEMYVNCTYDHPWSVDINNDGTFVRTRIEEIKSVLNTNKKPIVNKSESKWSIVNIEDIDPIKIGYDFETESDTFTISTINKCTIENFRSYSIKLHNCRTRVIGNINNPDLEITPGRGNLSFTTINLPKLGILANHDVDEFFRLLDDIIDKCIIQLLDRFEIQSSRKALNYPFLVQQGVMYGGDKLELEDTVGELLKNGTLSIAFSGLSECLIALIGKHHGESEEAQELGLRIVRHMRKRMDDEANKTKLNFSLLAAPAEGSVGKFAKQNKKEFGIIPGVTDKDYITNSFHVNVAYKTTMQHKVDVEAPYHELCNAG